MSKLDIALVGAAGKMGRRITAALTTSRECRLAEAIEFPEHPQLGKDIGIIAGVGKLDIELGAALDSAVKRVDAVIDFSLPESLMKTVECCVVHKVPLVTGITGLDHNEKLTLENAASEIPLVFSPNMSVGVNIMFKIAAEVAQVLGDDYDVEIIETHHRFKKDAPSGTANRLAEIIAEALGRDIDKVGCYGRKGIVGERDAKEIAIHSVRSGDVVGEHTVVFGSLGERFELTHRAHSRDNFARGAVIAAKFAATADPGLYDMQDVLGLKD